MARVGLFDYVGGEDADSVDAFQLEVGAFVGGELGRLKVRVGAFGGRFRVVALHFLFCRVGHS